MQSIQSQIKSELWFNVELMQKSEKKTNQNVPVGRQGKLFNFFSSSCIDIDNPIYLVSYLFFSFTFRHIVYIKKAMLLLPNQV